MPSAPLSCLQPQPWARATMPIAVQMWLPASSIALKLPGVPPLTPAQTEAIQVYREIVDEFAADIEFRVGDIQFLANQVTLHSRRAFRMARDCTAGGTCCGCGCAIPPDGRFRRSSAAPAATRACRSKGSRWSRRSTSRRPGACCSEQSNAMVARFRYVSEIASSLRRRSAWRRSRRSPSACVSDRRSSDPSWRPKSARP